MTQPAGYAKTLPPEICLLIPLLEESERRALVLAAQPVELIGRDWLILELDRRKGLIGAVQGLRRAIERFYIQPMETQLEPDAAPFEVGKTMSEAR